MRTRKLMIHRSKNFTLSLDGQVMLEFTILVAVLVLVIVASIPSLRQSVLNVFQSTASFLNGSNNSEEESGETPPLTPLGSTVPEISGSMLELINNFYTANNRYPRSWGDYAYTDLGLDPIEWKDKEFNGVIYKPNGSQLRLRPGEGYSFRIQDVDGNTHLLPYTYNWDLVYRIPNENRWYYHTTDGPVVVIETLEVIQQ